jgi:hypothetical protein
MILKLPMIRLRVTRTLGNALAEFLDHRLWEKDPSGPVVGLAKAMIEPPQNRYDLSLKCTKTKIN